MKQEVEADVVSARSVNVATFSQKFLIRISRLLAHAGFDARKAVDFWENRTADSTECSRAETPQGVSPKPLSLARKIMGSGHPVNEVRVERLKGELVRWEIERRAALARTENPPTESGVILAAA